MRMMGSERQDSWDKVRFGWRDTLTWLFDHDNDWSLSWPGVNHCSHTGAGKALNTCMEWHRMNERYSE